MGRNDLAGREGDAANASLAALGYNFRLLPPWLEVLLFDLMALLLVQTMEKPKTTRVA
jgi:hypothetical protein